MKKKTVKSCAKKHTKKTTASAVKAPVINEEPTSINCSAKVTPIKATLESEITPEIEIKKPACKHKDPRLPVAGTTFIKRFKGQDLEIQVTEEGLKWLGKTYKSLSGLAMDITGYPISGYIFFAKEIRKWQH